MHLKWFMIKSARLIIIHFLHSVSKYQKLFSYQMSYYPTFLGTSCSPQCTELNLRINVSQSYFENIILYFFPSLIVTTKYDIYWFQPTWHVITIKQTISKPRDHFLLVYQLSRFFFFNENKLVHSLMITLKPKH